MQNKIIFLYIECYSTFVSTQIRISLSIFKIWFVSEQASIFASYISDFSFGPTSSDPWYVLETLFIKKNSSCQTSNMKEPISYFKLNMQQRDCFVTYRRRDENAGHDTPPATRDFRRHAHGTTPSSSAHFEEAGICQK